MANNSIYSAFERMWQHVLNALGNKSDVGHTHDVVSTTANGLAPKRDGSTTKFLRADGTWAAPATGTSSNYGHVKLSDSTSSTSAASSGVAASPKAVKAAYDLANAAMPKSGGEFTGNITFAEGAEIQYLHQDELVNLSDVLTGYGEALEYFGENGMPKSGGTFTGTAYARTDARTINYGSGELVNITVRDSSDAAVSTKFIVMKRK